MKAKYQLAVGIAVLLLAGAGYSQTTSSTTNNTGFFTRANPSIRDNPGVLGHTFADFNYSWVDYHRDAGIDADGYIAGFAANTPVARGLDVGLGYNYYRENNHRNPFSGTPYDARYHGVGTSATFYAPMGGAKPFLTGGVGYQWSRGDIQSLRTFGHEWVWNAGAGIEIPMGFFSFTPRVTYADTMRNNSIGGWHYGAQVHHWFTEKVGGYFDATFHDPRNGGGAQSWTYTGGVRMRF
jgi:hypothetical protein